MRCRRSLYSSDQRELSKEEPGTERVFKEVKVEKAEDPKI